MGYFFPKKIAMHICGLIKGSMRNYKHLVVINNFAGVILPRGITVTHEPLMPQNYIK